MRAPRRRFRFLRSALSTATAVAAPRRRAARRIGGALTVGFVGGGVALNSLDEGRTATVLAALVPATVDYQVVSWKHRNSSPEEAKDAFDDYHSRWADEPLRVIMKLRGFYVKTGQVLAGQPDVLPAAYGRSLKILQDSVPAQPFDVVREIVESELGCALEDVFSTFDETPLGAASIGQVHRATLSDGTEVVVKVQYPAAERFFRLDMETIKGIFRIANPVRADSRSRSRSLARALSPLSLSTRSDVHSSSPFISVDHSTTVPTRRHGALAGVRWCTRVHRRHVRARIRLRQRSSLPSPRSQSI